ncbi:MAG: PAC2 family protein [Methanotrichaceae archaeon]|nr:PAC2 family protein [Methanotrichaceae archaeon]
MFESRTICIGGLPGIGSVGKVAVDYLAKNLDCRIVKPFISSGFPAQVIVSEGLVSLLQVELKVPKNRTDLFILSGDAQPVEVKEIYFLAAEILETVKSLGVTDFITLAAYVGESEEKVVAVASDLDMIEDLEKTGFAILRNGAIGGLNGLLAGLAPIYGMRGCCFLGTTSGNDPVDLLAARNLLEALKHLLKLEISLDDLEFEVDESKETCEEIDMNYR